MYKLMAVGLLIAIGLATTQHSVAQTKSEEMKRIINEYLTNKQFMGTVLVAEADHIILNRGYGYANLEWNIPNTPETKFRIASLTKQFTAASILLLEEKGKLKTTDAITKYFPDAPESWKKITIFNLLNHSSGIPDFTAFPEFKSFQLSPTTPTNTIDLFKNKPLSFLPGEKVSYSSSGYILLGALIEKITGKSYGSFVIDNIFLPLNMINSGYESNTDIISRRATGYTYGATGMINAAYSNMSVPYAAGALYSTTEDLLKWQRALFSKKILSATSLQKMITPYKDDYALGLFVSNNKGRTLIQHTGNISGFDTSISFYPDKKVTLVILGNVNSYAVDEISEALSAIAHNEKPEPHVIRNEIDVPTTVLKKYIGSYELSRSVDMTIWLEGNHLMSQVSTDSESTPLFAETETRFFTKPIDAQIEFFENEQHTITHLVLHQFGTDKKAIRKYSQ